MFAKLKVITDNLNTSVLENRLFIVYDFSRDRVVTKLFLDKIGAEKAKESGFGCKDNIWAVLSEHLEFSTFIDNWKEKRNAR